MAVRIGGRPYKKRGLWTGYPLLKSPPAAPDVPIPEFLYQPTYGGVYREEIRVGRITVRQYRRTSVIFYNPGGGGTDAQADGVTFTVTTSLVSGVVTADSTTEAQTLTVTTSLVSGAASASYSSDAQILTVTTSLVSGAVSADSQATGVTLPVTVSLVPGAFTADSQFDGVVLPVTVSLIPGEATGGSGSVDDTGDGVTFTVTTSLVAGAASAEASASGATFTVPVSLIDGDQTASSEVSINWGTITMAAPTFVATNGTDIFTGNKYWLRRSKPNQRRLSTFIRWLLKQPIS